jgi:hypothetical protein
MNTPKGPVPTSARLLQPGLTEALELLLVAVEQAREGGRPPSEFTVEAPALADAGLTALELGRMIRAGIVAYGTATPPATTQGAPGAAAPGRLFLTDAGAAAVQAARAAAAAADAWPPLRPRWDPHRREVWLGKTLIKRFQRTATNQELLLAAFEELGWPPYVDDPLPPEPGQDQRSRLGDAIKCLNRRRRCGRLHFRMDGTGEGARWEVVRSRRKRVSRRTPQAPA